MLAAEHGWGGGGGRPFLPRAFSVADATAGETGVRLTFVLEDVGPGTHELAGLAEGDGLLLTGPLGRPFSPPRDVNPGAAGAILAGGGIGLAPLALLRRDLAARGFPERSLLGFRDEAHSGGLELFRCSELRLASEDGHAGHRGYVTDLLAVMLEGDDAAATAVVYACGPPAMLEAVRALCEECGVAAELALESPMACGYGACFGCAMPLRGGGYMRLLRRRPGGRCGCHRDGLESRGRSPMSAARRALAASSSRTRSSTRRGPSTLSPPGARVRGRRGGALPFSAYVSKTITSAPRAGNPPPRLWEEPAAMVNSIVAEQGRGRPRPRSPGTGRSPRAADRLQDGDERRGVQRAR